MKSILPEKVTSRLVLKSTCYVCATLYIFSFFNQSNLNSVILFTLALENMQQVFLLLSGKEWHLQFSPMQFFYFMLLDLTSKPNMKYHVFSFHVILN